MDDTAGGIDPDSLFTSNDLARGYLEAGWLDEAIPMFERTLADRERLLGETRQTLFSRNNLGQAYQAAGRLDEAIAMFERTLAEAERVLGRAHPLTLLVRTNLASARRQDGRGS